MFTLWQFVTYCQWSDIVRALFVQTDQHALTGIFFISFLLIVTMVLLNVVIASLVNNFQQHDPGLPEFTSPTRKDPFLGLWQPLSELYNLEELDLLATKNFATMCGVGTPVTEGRLDRSGFRVGLSRLRCVPPIVFYDEHWQNFVRAPGLVGEDDTIDLQVMRAAGGAWPVCWWQCRPLPMR